MLFVTILSLITLTCISNASLSESLRGISKKWTFLENHLSGRLRIHAKRPMPIQIDNHEAESQYQYFQFYQTYDEFKDGSWQNNTQFGRFWIDHDPIQGNSSRLEILDYVDTLGYVAVPFEIIQLGNDQYLIDNDQNGNVQCQKTESHAKSIHIRRPREIKERAIKLGFEFVAPVFIQIDDPELEWILWGTRLINLFAQGKEGDYQLIGLDSFTNEVVYEKDFNATRVRTQIMHRFSSSPFDSSSLIAIPTTVNCN